MLTYFGNTFFNTAGNAKKIIFVNSVICGLAVTVINHILNYARYSKHFRDNLGFLIITLAITFASATVFSCTVFFIFYLLNIKRQKQIEKRLNEDDDE